MVIVEVVELSRGSASRGERLEELGSAEVAMESGSIGEVWLRRMLQNSSSGRAKVIWMVELALLPLCCWSPERDADDSDCWISSTAYTASTLSHGIQISFSLSRFFRHS